MNCAYPCPCGWYGDDRNECTCSLSMVQRYQKRISGPLMDRIDIHLGVQRGPYQKLEAAGEGEASKVIRARVAAARHIQAERSAPLNRAQWAPDVLVNGDMGPAEVQRFCELDQTGKNLMRAAVQQMNLSARAYHRVLKLAGSPLGAITGLSVAVLKAHNQIDEALQKTRLTLLPKSVTVYINPFRQTAIAHFLYKTHPH